MRRRVLLLLKRSAFDLYVNHHQEPSLISCHQTFGNLEDRHMVHQITVEVCKNELIRRGLPWTCLLRSDLKEPIKNVDLVITVGGDGTLLQAGRFIDGSIPVLGVNSDPTQPAEVNEKMELYDATRSTGYLCAASKENFSQVLDDVLEGKREPLALQRISTYIEGNAVMPIALNDVLLSHPSPAAVTRCTFRIHKRNCAEHVSPLIHSRSSGLRVCTATGSTAAMHSAGGYVMPLSCNDLQYMVREPIMPPPMHKEFMHGWIKADEFLRVRWACRQGNVYFDGPHSFYSIHFGSIIDISIGAPLYVFL